MKDYSLYYWDQRLTEAEVVDFLDRAWNELFDLEFDAIFGAWRGIHLEVATDTVHITWESMYAGPPLDVVPSPGAAAPSEWTSPGWNFWNWRRQRLSGFASSRRRAASKGGGPGKIITLACKLWDLC